MRYFVVYLEDDARVRYRLLVSGDLEGNFAWDRHLLTNIPLESPLSLSGLKNVIRSNASVGDYVFWYPDLRIRTVSVINGNRHFLSAFRAFRSRSHQHAIDSLLAHPLAASNPYPSFSDETLRFHTLPLEAASNQIQIDHQMEIADPWGRVVPGGTGPVQTTAQQIQFGAVSPPARSFADILEARIAARWGWRQPATADSASIPHGYRFCRSGELIYWGYMIRDTASHWRGVEKNQIGRKVTRTPQVIAPDFPWPEWIRRWPHNHAYRYLEIGEFIQEGDVVLHGDGTARPATPMSIGMVVDAHSMDCLIRVIGRDGWKLLLEGVDNPVDGSFDLTEGRLTGSNSWFRVAPGHSVAFDSYDYRRLVPGYGHNWRPCDSQDPPIGYVWVALNEMVVRSSGYMLKDNGTIMPLGGMGDISWFYAPVERRFLRVDENWDWNAFQVTPGSFSLDIQLLSFKCSNVWFEDATYWVLNRHGIMAIYASGAHGSISTMIGRFFPTAFKINGQTRVIFCTDAIPSHELPDLLRRSLLNTVGGIQQLISVTVNQAPQQTPEFLDRQVEL